MTTKIAGRVVDFAPPRPDDPGTGRPAEPEWDGTQTRFRLTRTLCRDFVFYGPGSAAGDTVTFDASRDASGRWIGPEAAEVVSLVRSGMFQGTPEGDGFLRDVLRVEDERGVHGGGEDGKPLRPELKAPDTPTLLKKLSADNRFAARLKDPSPELRKRHAAWERRDVLSQMRAELGLALSTAPAGEPVTDMSGLSTEALEVELRVRRERRAAEDAK